MIINIKHLSRHSRMENNFLYTSLKVERNNEGDIVIKDEKGEKLKKIPGRNTIIVERFISNRFVFILVAIDKDVEENTILGEDKFTRSYNDYKFSGETPQKGIISNVIIFDVKKRSTFEYGFITSSKYSVSLLPSFNGKEVVMRYKKNITLFAQEKGKWGIRRKFNDDRNEFDRDECSLIFYGKNKYLLTTLSAAHHPILEFFGFVDKMKNGEIETEKMVTYIEEIRFSSPNSDIGQTYEYVSDKRGTYVFCSKTDKEKFMKWNPKENFFEQFRCLRRYCSEKKFPKETSFLEREEFSGKTYIENKISGDTISKENFKHKNHNFRRYFNVVIKNMRKEFSPGESSKEDSPYPILEVENRIDKNGYVVTIFTGMLRGKPKVYTFLYDLVLREMRCFPGRRGEEMVRDKHLDIKEKEKRISLNLEYENKDLIFL